MVDVLQEELDFAHLQELDWRDRETALNAIEHAAIGSGVKILIKDREVNIVDGATELEGNSMDVKDAYNIDPDMMLTSKGFILNPTPGEAKLLTGIRAGKKVRGTIGIFGIEGALASMQGTETGIILANTNNRSRAEVLNVFFSIKGRQIRPEEIGADKWKLTPTWSTILEPLRLEKSGTMVFRVKPPVKK
ncbi:MAG: hypothetical protein ACM3IJ_04745 [Candidatus Levyibacteriota bacterium]